MPTPQFPGVGDNAGLPELKDAYISISRYLTYLLSALDTLNISRLDAKVIIAETITTDKIAAEAITTDKIDAGAVTADKITVDELSAISADLGEINAGTIRGIEIFGSYIATAEGTYPRSEMDVDGSFLAALASATSSVKINPVWLVGSPRLEYDDGDVQASIYTGGSSFDALIIDSLRNITFLVGPSCLIKFPSWRAIYNVEDNVTLADSLSGLQSQVDSLQSQINSLDSRISALESG